MMAEVIRSVSSSESDSPRETQDPVTVQASNKPTPIDPFSFKITSWEEWLPMLSPQPPPRSNSLSIPPKIDLFSKSPLPFTPYSGPIRLDEPVTKKNGSIDLFNFTPYKDPPLSEPVEEKTFEPIEGAISAPLKKDTEGFKFDWPSEDIRKACEDMFPGNEEWMLPALNWIAPEKKTIRDTSVEGERMPDIQYR